MISKNDVLSVLPAFKDEVRLVTWRQSSNRLMQEILKAHVLYEQDYDKIFELFDTGEIYSTCKGLWDFCKYNIPYTIETEDEQSVKSPSAILQSSEKADCKHYSLFIGGVLGAISAAYDEPWTWCYRFACYDTTKIPEHVFVVVKDGNKEIWIDPVLTGFNQHKQPKSYIDKTVPMAIYSISGIGSEKSTNTGGVEVEILDPAKAEIRFFVMVALNLLSLKDILNSDKTVLYGPVRKYFMNNGFDFQHLLVILAQ